MIANLLEKIIEIKLEIKKINDLSQLNLFKTNLFGKNGYFNQQIIKLQQLPKEKKAQIGIIINQSKEEIKKLLFEHDEILHAISINKQIKSERIDISLPGRHIEYGGLHPITSSIIRMESFFKTLGFSTINGPEIEDVYHNFDALNVSKDHPSRSNRDTFWLNKKYLLRTQTSGIQIRIMKSQKPPIRIISYGRVYRNDNDNKHTPMFHQMEGLLVDKYINFSHAKGILHNFLCNFFQKKVKIRFRPSFFPFTTPSAEIDIMEKNGLWLEILGCGMVHPKIFNNVNIDPKKFSGFAFGVGIERLTMLLYNINDLRILFDNDIRFLKQFK